MAVASAFRPQPALTRSTRSRLAGLRSAIGPFAITDQRQPRGRRSMLDRAVDMRLRVVGVALKYPAFVNQMQVKHVEVRRAGF